MGSSWKSGLGELVASKGEAGVFVVNALFGFHKPNGNVLYRNRPLPPASFTRAVPGASDMIRTRPC